MNNAFSSKTSLPNHSLSVEVLPASEVSIYLDHIRANLQAGILEPLQPAADKSAGDGVGL